jgi:hypothetical protein
LFTTVVSVLVGAPAAHTPTTAERWAGIHARCTARNPWYFGPGSHRHVFVEFENLAWCDLSTLLIRCHWRLTVTISTTTSRWFIQPHYTNLW